MSWHFTERFRFPFPSWLFCGASPVDHVRNAVVTRWCYSFLVFFLDSFECLSKVCQHSKKCPVCTVELRDISAAYANRHGKAPSGINAQCLHSLCSELLRLFRWASFLFLIHMLVFFPFAVDSLVTRWARWKLMITEKTGVAPALPSHSQKVSSSFFFQKNFRSELSRCLDYFSFLSSRQRQRTAVTEFVGEGHGTPIVVVDRQATVEQIDCIIQSLNRRKNDLITVCITIPPLKLDKWWKTERFFFSAEQYCLSQTAAQWYSGETTGHESIGKGNFQFFQFFFHFLPRIGWSMFVLSFHWFLYFFSFFGWRNWLRCRSSCRWLIPTKRPSPRNCLRYVRAANCTRPCRVPRAFRWLPIPKLCRRRYFPRRSRSTPVRGSSRRRPSVSASTRPLPVPRSATENPKSKSTYPPSVILMSRCERKQVGPPFPSNPPNVSRNMNHQLSSDEYFSSFFYQINTSAKPMSLRARVLHINQSIDQIEDFQVIQSTNQSITYYWCLMIVLINQSIISPERFRYTQSINQSTKCHSRISFLPEFSRSPGFDSFLHRFGWREN